MSPLGWFLLLVVVAAVAVGVLALRRRPEAPSAPTPPPTLPEPDDLSTLGLSKVRARPAGERPDPDRARFEDVPRHGAARPAEARRTAPLREAAPPDDTPSRAAWGDDAGAWGEAPVRYLLRSLAARVGGPVAVVRHEGDRFRVAARTDGGPLASIRGTALGLDGPARLIRADLGGLAVLVGGEARAVPLGPYAVLIGGSGEAEPGYLDLLAALAGAPSPARPATPPPAEGEGTKASGSGSKGRKDSSPAPEPEATPEGPPVPRATIIAEEQSAATEAGRPLAFALVTLADAEDRLTRGTPEAVATAEAALRDRLLSAPDVRRVEPFGDLLFGVFLDLEPRPTAAWCDRLASGAPPLFIGAVAPAVGDPTGIRDAAAEALHDAYDQRRSRVVEV